MATRLRRRWARSGPTAEPDPVPARSDLLPAPPDFVGVGTQRSGTTWWFELIAAHPDVYSAGRKERHFFDRFCAEAMAPEHIEEYHASFARPAGALSGEWTPRYAYDFWTPPLLSAAAPDAKLLFLVRDPVARLHSGVAHEIRRSNPQTPLDLAMVYSDAAIRGRYGAQLARLLSFFPRDRILVLQYEKCRLNTPDELRRTYQFLGLDESFLPSNISTPAGTSSAASNVVVTEAALDAFVRELAPDIQAFSELVPELDLGLWTQFQSRLEDDGQQ